MLKNFLFFLKTFFRQVYFFMAVALLAIPAFLEDYMPEQYPDLMKLAQGILFPISSSLIILALIISVIELKKIIEQKKAVDYLGEYYSQGIELFQRKILSEIEFTEWTIDINKWLNDLSQHITNSFTSAEAIIIQKPGSPMAASLACFNDEHRIMKLNLQLRLNKLEALIIRYSILLFTQGANI